MLSAEVTSEPAIWVPVLTSPPDTSSRLNAFSDVDAVISVVMMLSGSATTSTHIASVPKHWRTILNDASRTSPTLSGRSCGENWVVAMSRTLVLEAQPVLQCALDRRVERVEPVQGQRLGRSEAPPRRRVGPVVAEHAVCQREPSALVHRPRALVDHALAEHEVAEQPALLAQPDLGAVGELARLPEVVHERGADQQIGVEPPVQRRRLDRQRRHR